jgi:uncharacterized OB-fold protein
MEIARYWRLNNQRYNLTGSICTCCGKPSFSQRPVCDACGEQVADGRSAHRHAARHESALAAAAGK